MNDEKIAQQFRDERSMELYGKHEIQLMIAERMKFYKLLQKSKY